MSQYIEHESKYVDQNQNYVDRSQASLALEASFGTGNEKQFLDLIRQTIHDSFLAYPDVQLNPRWRTHKSFEDFIVKQAKGFMARGDYTQAEKKENQNRLNAIMIKVPMERRTKQHPGKFRWILNTQQILEKAVLGPNHPDFERFMMNMNTRANAAANSTGDQFIQLHLYAPLTTCTFCTRLAKREKAIESGTVKTPSFDVRIYGVESKKTHAIQLRLRGICVYCGHEKNNPITKAALKKIEQHLQSGSGFYLF